MHGSWKLTIPLAPEMFDTLHVPLVDDCNHCLALTLIYCSEEILVSLVDENLLDSWEEHIERLNVPVYEVLIQTLFGEGLGSC